MCGRVIQNSGPLRLAIVEGLDVSDSRMGNVPSRYNGAPSQELLVIRENQRPESHSPGDRELEPCNNEVRAGRFTLGARCRARPTRMSGSSRVVVLEADCPPRAERSPSLRASVRQ